MDSDTFMNRSTNSLKYNCN